jgi:adenosylcobinamide kinase / adenosylcobinamide-phosphate guanylyltransferase
LAAESFSQLPPLTLVLGGQRSGKSAHAEDLIDDRRAAVYLATGQALDAEMTKRIERHQKRRGPNWTTVEEPINIANALIESDSKDRPILIDSLAMWVANLLDQGYDVKNEAFTLAEALEGLTSPLVVVSDEAGLGVIPENVLARSFLDELGAVNQAIAARADKVVFVAAGLPVVLKDKEK